jgi:hypothetical protein
MHTVIRSYTGAPTLADDLNKRSKEVETLIKKVPGFIAYYLMKTSDGAASITVCENRSGCEESSKVAANWLRENMPTLKVNPPHIIAGEISFRFANYPARV